VTQRSNTAVFIARAWWDDGQFRARISFQVDIRAEPEAETQTVTADPAEVRRQLELWLDESSKAASH
jgi:hypothetical protein